jgi:hypothetical protein
MTPVKLRESIISFADQVWHREEHGVTNFKFSGL